MPDAELSDPLKQLRKELIEEATKRDRRVADTLSAKTDALDTRLLAYHTDVMTALAALAKTTEAHAAWMMARDIAQATIDREKAEQAQKETWLAEEAAKVKAALDATAAIAAAERKAIHDRWAPYIPIALGLLATVIGGSVLYVLDNLNNLRWGLQTQVISIVVILAMAAAIIVFRMNP